MEYKTLAQIRQKIKNDLDLNDEQFITSSELLAYINEAIDDVEADIHTIYEDYFLTSAALPITSGTADYNMPSDIYANKIRGIVYSNGSRIYNVKRLQRHDQFEEMAFINQYISGTEDLQYKIVNSSAAAGVKIRFFPTPTETNASALTIWYIRNANTLSADTDLCDIPEFTNYVYQFVKVRCYEKEIHPNLEQATVERERLKRLMQDTLRDMIPDADTEIEKDLSFYEDMS